MRRITEFLAVLLLMAMLSFSVSANSASEVRSYSTVTSDSSCQVNMTVTLDVRSADGDLSFPVPAESSNVTLNGSWVRAPLDGDVRVIDLSRVVGNMTGTMTVNISYTLRDVIHTAESGNLELQLPILAGFSHPVERMEFSVTLPGQIDTLPAFQSGYHQASIEKEIRYEVSGAAVTGTFLNSLKDHETLTMTLVVTEDMFPQSIIYVQNYDAVLIAMAICAAVALLYWIIALRNGFILPQRTGFPPDGCSAGQLGSILCLQGVDLSLTVLSWAQLGYITLRQERSGRVKLLKRMDMGNERSQWEQQLFGRLFGKLQVVDTAGYHYAQLSRTMAGKPVGMGELLERSTGNLRLFRGIAALIGMFSGVCMAIAISGGAFLQGLLILILAAVGTFCAWTCQSWAVDAILGNRRGLYRALLICAVWLLVSLLAGAFHVGLWTVLGILLAGVLYAWGGQRTDLGRQTAAQVLGLQRYLSTADKLLVQRMQDNDPGYFYDMLPYAMALGVEQAFASRFGRGKLSGCPYLITEQHSEMTASQWSRKLQQVRSSMDRRSRMLPLQKSIAFIKRLTK